MELHGYVHLGLNPESVYIVPETHGIHVVSFYHVTPIGETVKTVSGLNNYLYWYPMELMVNKIAQPAIDVELAKKIAIYLLGDKSGVGTVLRMKHLDVYINFLQKRHTTAKEAFEEYRELLKTNFPKKFHVLKI